MKQVSKDDFYKAVGRLNVHPTIVNGTWPYVSDWRFLDTPHRHPFGRSVGKPDGTSDYFLAA